MLSVQSIINYRILALQGRMCLTLLRMDLLLLALLQAIIYIQFHKNHSLYTFCIKVVHHLYCNIKIFKYVSMGKYIVSRVIVALTALNLPALTLYLYSISITTTPFSTSAIIMEPAHQMVAFVTSTGLDKIVVPIFVLSVLES